LAVVNALRGFQAGELTAALESEGVQVDAVNLDCLIAAADRLAAQLRQPGTLGLLLTGHVSAALCLANRHGGVRAVAAGDLPSMAAAVESVGANLLILDAAALTTFQLRQMAVQFCRGGVRQCPEKLRSRLA
jgi:ribose 5-phosphate isomerase RpiB